MNGILHVRPPQYQEKNSLLTKGFCFPDHWQKSAKATKHNILNYNYVISVERYKFCFQVIMWKGFQTEAEG